MRPSEVGPVNWFQNLRVSKKLFAAFGVMHSSGAGKAATPSAAAKRSVAAPSGSDADWQEF